MFYLDPIKYKFTLSDPVPHPIESNINSSGSSLENSVIGKFVSCYIACDGWVGWLFATHFCEGNEHG